MGYPGGLKTKKIGVVGHDDSTLGTSERGLPFIRRSQKFGIPRGCDIDASAAKASGDGQIATLIQVEA